MRLFLKILLTLGVALPLAAFVAGSLVAVSEPSPSRERIVIQDGSSPTRPATGPRDEQSPGRTPSAEDSGDLAADDGDDADEEDEGDDNGVRGTRDGGDDDDTGDGGGEDDDTNDDDGENDD